MKTKRAVIVGFLIAAGLFSLVAFALCPSRSAGFYISYAAIVLGLAAYFGAMFTLLCVRFEKVAWRLPLLRVGRNHLLRAVVLTLVYIALRVALSVLSEAPMGDAPGAAVTAYAVAHAAILGIAVYRVNALTAGAALIDGAGAGPHAQAAALRGLAAEAAGFASLASRLPDGTRQEAEKLVKEVSEAIRYSDPVAPEAFLGMDDALRDRVSGLKGVLQQMADARSTDANALRVCVAGLLDLVRERNEALKRAK